MQSGESTVGIFCIENWAGDLRSRSSVKPLLDFVATEFGVRYIHQRISSLEELDLYMDRWTNLDTYEVGYLALHGTPGKVCVGNESMTVRELLDRTWDAPEPWTIDLTGKTLYFGSCSTFARSEAFADACKVTGARLTCGYRRSVPWDDGAAFEILLFSALAHYDSPFDALRSLQRRHGSFIERLGFDWMPRRGRR